jgi:hypothetical protein
MNAQQRLIKLNNINTNLRTQLASEQRAQANHAIEVCAVAPHIHIVYSCPSNGTPCKRAHK